MSMFKCRRARSGERLCRVIILLLSISLIFGVLIYIKSNLRRFPRRIIHVETENLPIPHQRILIDLDNFRYILQSNVCHLQDVYLLTLVHSTPSHIEERSVIRSTWGGVKQISGRKLRTVFLTGQSPSLDAQRQLQKESKIYGDIIQGNFMDSYNNLTYKHLMGLKWTLNHCNSSHFVLKIDEDAYVDMFQFVDFLLEIYDDSAVKTLMCHVFPEGTPTLRQGKWMVQETDFPHDRYPRYCAGLAYLISNDVVRDFVVASGYVPFFWIDDVYVTGLLAEAIGLRHLSMNLRTTIDPLPLKKWLGENSQYPCRFLIGNLGDIANWPRLLEELWLKTILVSRSSKRKVEY